MNTKTAFPVERKYVSAPDLEKMTGITASAWATWRRLGGGPAFYRIHGRCYYDREEVFAWIERRRSERKFNP